MAKLKLTHSELVKIDIYDANNSFLKNMDSLSEFAKNLAPVVSKYDKTEIKAFRKVFDQLSKIAKSSKSTKGKRKKM